MPYSTADSFSAPYSIPPEEWFETVPTVTIKEGMEQNPELREALEKVIKKIGIDIQSNFQL